MTSPSTALIGLPPGYRLGEVLGSWPGATICRCTFSSDERAREAAIVEAASMDPQDVADLMESARAVAGMDFDGVQRIERIQAGPEGLVVISEAIEGRGIHESAGRGTLLTPQRATYLGVELSRILAHLHARGVPVSLIPADAVREVPRRGLVLRHPWLLGVKSRMPAASERPLSGFEAALPPEVAAGKAPGTQAGVYAVGYLVAFLLGLSTTAYGKLPGLPVPPPLATVLGKAIHPNPRRRQRDMRQLGRELARARPGARRDFMPVPRIEPPPKRNRPGLAPRRLPLPVRPVPEGRAAKVRPWMVAVVGAAGISVFLLLAPRISNPLTPLQGTIEDLRAVFKAGLEPAVKEAPVSSDSVIPGQPFKVPDLVGRQQAEVQNEAGRMGLDLVVTQEPSTEAPPGTVLRQIPEAGAILSGVYEVTVVVSTGELRPALPSVVGKTALEAREILTAMGFLVLEVPAISKEKPVGEVLGQEPVAGRVLRRGDQIVLSVSQGPQRVAIPSLVALSEADAVRIVDELGLKVRTEFVDEGPAGSQPGAVIAHEPGPGSLAEPGAEIIIKVLRPQPATVPLVIGMELDQAIATLDGSGLAVSFVVQRPSPGVDRPAVTEQEPPPGTRVARGTSVKLVVALPAPSPAPTPAQ